MNGDAFRCRVVFAVVVSVILVAVGWEGYLRAEAPASQAQQPVVFSANNPLPVLFEKARKAFLNKKLKESASEIRQASSYLGKEMEYASGWDWESLSASRRELDTLAGAVQKGEVHSIRELDLCFAEAEHALADYYHTRASESSKKGEQTAGQYLAAAAVHLENAYKALMTSLDRMSAAAIRDAKEFKEKIEENEWPRLRGAMEALRTEIDKVGRKIETARTPGQSSIQVSQKAVGSVDLTSAIVKAANQTMPSVVYIEVTQSTIVQNPFLPFENDPFFRRFFNIPKMPRKFKQEVKGLGSGMILDARGHILTNNHVAGGATKMTVTLADGSLHEAKLVGADPKTDLAVIKIHAPRNLPHVVFGDSDKVEVGEWVVAIGAPQALEKTVTQGIISAKHRTGITEPNSYQDFLQTDAAINPGNSGGPLLNLHGQVIGVNAAIATMSGGFEGIGFTIPGNMAVYVANALITRGKVERGWLGVTIRNLTSDLAIAARNKDLKGALVLDVVKGGPADKGGMKKDDVVVAYNGKEVPDSSMFRNEASETSPGKTVTITVLRNGLRKDLEIVVGTEQDALKAMTASLQERLGAGFRPLTPDETGQYGLNAGLGVMVDWIDPNGPLGQAGVTVGDGIMAVNDQPVSGVEGLAGIVGLLRPGEKVSVLVLDHRTGATGTVAIVLR